VTQTYSDGGVGPGINTSLATNLPGVAQLNNGTGTITVSSSDKLSYIRSTTLPQAAFSASISLTVSVRDDSEADGQILTTTATPFSAIAFDSGNLVRYGRLRLQNAFGSQLIAMPIPIETQYWNGTGFVTNALDNCTAIALANITLGNYQPNLVAGDTTATVGGSFASGKGMIRLLAPGSAKHGSVDLTANLTGANMTYLQGAWSGTSYTNDPKARATFGLFRNTDQMIYQRENF
jgi:MSHA biogenesis protein MshQ